jgi:hypothetical protein
VGVAEVFEEWPCPCVSDQKTVSLQQSGITCSMKPTNCGRAVFDRLGGRRQNQFFLGLISIPSAHRYDVSVGGRKAAAISANDLLEDYTDYMASM